MTEKIIFLGKLATKPLIKALKNGTKKICTFDVVETISGESKPKWHKVVVWDKQADGCNIILDKGKEVFVQGRVIYQEYVNSSGELKKYEEIYVDKIGFVTL